MRISDWSSDVCSSDLVGEVALQEFGSPDLVLVRLQKQEGDEKAQITAIDKVKAALGSEVDFRRTEFVGPKVGAELIQDAVLARSEERRAGKECGSTGRSRRARIH